jgi:hypothetical protein
MFSAILPQPFLQDSFPDPLFVGHDSQLLVVNPSPLQILENSFPEFTSIHVIVTMSHVTMSMSMSLSRVTISQSMGTQISIQRHLMRECLQKRVEVHSLQSMVITMSLMMAMFMAFEPMMPVVMMVKLMMAKSLFESTPTRCGHKGYKSHKKYK